MKIKKIDLLFIHIKETHKKLNSQITISIVAIESFFQMSFH